MPVERILWVATAAFAAAFVAFVIMGRIDDRLFENVSVWAKPTKFALATAIHYGTFALIMRGLSESLQDVWWLAAIVVFSIAFAVFEVAYIAIQAARAMGSHFNTSTPFYSAMFSLMAFGALMVLMPAPLFGSLPLLDSETTMSAPLKWAIAIGLIGGTLLTLVTASQLGANGSHFVGQPPGDHRLMPFTHWSLEIGDLRPAHFFATHMMQAVPLAGLVLSRLLDTRLAIAAVVGFAILWGAICIAAFQNAQLGRPILGIWT